MVETHQLYAEAKRQVGAKVCADALGVGVAHFYKLCSDPMSLDVPIRDDVQRLQNLLEVLAARPHAKPALILFRLYFDDLFARLIDHDAVTPLDCHGITDHVERLCREFADLVHEVKPGFVSDRIASEGSQLMAAVTKLVRCAEVADNAEQKPKTPLRAS